MSEKQEYPKRGEMSEDGRCYTHTDGSVHELEIGTDNGCHTCSIDKRNGECLCSCNSSYHFRLVEGAYVPTDEEREACDMARAMIKQCGNSGRFVSCKDRGAYLCNMIGDKTCPARVYLAEHGDLNAWEVVK